MDEDMNPSDFESDEEEEQIGFNEDVLMEDFDLDYDSSKTLEVEVEKDVISALPDSLLVHILDFLPTIEESIRTGTLSKRWQYVWTNVHTLTFIRTYQNPRPISDFISFVSKTLSQRPISKLKKFKLDFDYEEGFSSRVSEWIRYALSCHVEQLDLNFVHEVADDSFVVPKEVFASPILTELGLRYCVFTPAGPIGWKMLTKLSIEDLKLQEETIRNILSGSPVLELLKLGYCYGFKRLDITSVSVKKLIINSYFDPYKKEDDIVLEVFAPHILSLDIVGDVSVRKFVLVDVQSLVEAKIDFVRYFPDDEGRCYITDVDYDMVKGFLQSLHHTNELIVGRWCMQIISTLELIGWRSPVSKHKSLRTTNFIKRSCFPALVNLLQSSPYLETLIINDDSVTSSWCHGGSYTRENYLTWKERAFRCLQLHLKTVEITCFVEWDPECELIQFLLQNSRVLEKMIIYPGTSMQSVSDSLVLLQLTLKLLNCPRASKDAVVLFPQFL